MTTVLTGVVAGCVLALGLTRLLQASLFGVGPDDPITFAIVTLTLLTVAYVARALRVARAMRVDPTAALRHE